MLGTERLIENLLGLFDRGTPVQAICEGSILANESDILTAVRNCTASIVKVRVGDVVLIYRQKLSSMWDCDPNEEDEAGYGF